MQPVNGDIQTNARNNKDIHIDSTIRATCYNIWNFNDEWERRAEMIVENIINVRDFDS